MRLDDFRVSTSDLDGSGEARQPLCRFRHHGENRPCGLPAPTIVANQGFATVTRVDGIVVEVPSHNPALPDDGNLETGEPTEISIDVTDCDRTPPGDREECFKVETGEVDCVPGGGAFIYHMPVGPRVRRQVGAVAHHHARHHRCAPVAARSDRRRRAQLDDHRRFARRRRAPHRLRHRDLCRAGRRRRPPAARRPIDIEIPPDLECPPRGEPDLKVEKRADDSSCTLEGPCDFTIRVTNVGDEPYNGPIVLEEVTGPGAAPVVSGPNVPWLCPPMVSPMVCTHPGPTLNPGEWVELKLGFAPGPGWDWDAIRNCAEYDYTASGFPEVFGSTDNDRACASIPICRRGDPECDPPVEKKVDLRIIKDPRGVACSLDGVCWFNIRVYNNGDDNYAGPLTVIDEYPTGVPASSTFGPNPPWACGPIGGRSVPVRPSGRCPCTGSLHPDLGAGGRAGQLWRPHPQLRGGERHTWARRT